MAGEPAAKPLSPTSEIEADSEIVLISDHDEREAALNKKELIKTRFYEHRQKEQAWKFRQKEFPTLTILGSAAIWLSPAWEKLSQGERAGAFAAAFSITIISPLLALDREKANRNGSKATAREGLELCKKLNVIPDPWIDEGMQLSSEVGPDYKKT
jgi:hypothetical protein